MSRFGGYEHNPYYAPEKCGVKLIGVLEDVGADYSFDTIIVIQDLETRQVYAAHDEGCSCPTPFENYSELSEMVHIQNIDDLKRFIGDQDSTYRVKWPFDDRFALYDKVIPVLAEARK